MNIQQIIKEEQNKVTSVLQEAKLTKLSPGSEPYQHFMQFKSLFTDKFANEIQNKKIRIFTGFITNEILENSEFLPSMEFDKLPFFAVSNSMGNEPNLFIWDNASEDGLNGSTTDDFDQYFQELNLGTNIENCTGTVFYDSATFQNLEL